MSARQGIVLALLTLIVTLVAGFGPGWLQRQEDAANTPPKLVIPGPQKPWSPDDRITLPEWVPNGPGKGTLVSIKNAGKHEALVRQVIISDIRWIPTPHRQPPGIGEGKPFRVVLRRSDYSPTLGQFMKRLERPAAMPGNGQWTVMELVLVDPGIVGRTLVGTVTIVYDGGDQKHVNEPVHLDALKAEPR